MKKQRLQLQISIGQVSRNFFKNICKCGQMASGVLHCGRASSYIRVFLFPKVIL